jgi:hypothetical protein
LAEHPFGTLKCRAGYRHFLVRGFDRVRGEWNLMALCYNFTRVLNIIGLDGFITYLRTWFAELRNFVLQYAICVALARLRAVLGSVRASPMQNAITTRSSFS